MITQIQIKVPVPIAEYYLQIPKGERSKTIRAAIDDLLREPRVDEDARMGIQYQLERSKFAKRDRRATYTPLNVYVHLDQKTELSHAASKLHTDMSTLVRLALEIYILKRRRVQWSGCTSSEDHTTP